MDESELQKRYNHHIYPRDSKINSDKGFVITDNGIMGGSQWVRFHLKDEKSFHFDSFVGAIENFLFNQ